MFILSLDCSTKSTGYALFNEKGILKEYGLFIATEKDPILRIKNITKKIQDYLTKKQEEKILVDKIIVEEVRPTNENEGIKNAHTTKILFFLQAALNFMLHDNFKSINIEYLYPSQWRKSVGIKTGKGILRQELKQQDIKTANEMFSLNLSSDDIADAILIGKSYFVKNVERDLEKESTVWG